MFGKLALILTSISVAVAHQNRYLRGPGNATSNISTAMVPYYNIKSTMCPKHKVYYWTKSSNVTSQRDL